LFEEQTVTMKCRTCGQENSASAKYCINCGKPLNPADNPTKIQAYQSSPSSTEPKKEDPSMRFLSSAFETRGIDATLSEMVGSGPQSSTRSQTTPAPSGQRCQFCQIEITGPAVMALGGYWHPEHFKCAQCGNPIGIGKFQERNGKAYCGNHAEGTSYTKSSTGGPICAQCKLPLSGQYLKACGNTFHKECLKCCDCNKSLQGEPFVNKGGFPCCKQCNAKNLTAQFK
jgi:hypothetical protein